MCTGVCFSSLNTRSGYQSMYHQTQVAIFRGQGCQEWLLPSWPRGVLFILVGATVTYFSCFPLDVLSTGPWSTLKELEDMDLRRLVEALPSSVLRCRVTSTTQKYL